MRIQHVSVPIAPGEEARTRARRFYAGLLHLEEIRAPDALSDLQVVWFRLDDTELHLLPEELTAQDHSGRHFCLAVDDLEGIRFALEEAGVAVVGAVTIPGRPRYFVRDPFGNLIELTTIDGDYLELQARSDGPA